MRIEDITEGTMVCIRTLWGYGTGSTIQFKTVERVTTQHIIAGNAYYSRRTGESVGARAAVNIRTFIETDKNS